MTYFLFNRKHLKEYAVYGSIAGLCHSLTVWYFLQKANNGAAAILFIGSILFMFVIMIYAIKLTRRAPDYNRTWGMLISGQITVLAGVLVSVISSTILCFIFIPGFISGSSENDTGTVGLIFMTATFENYGAGAFISGMIAYALKPNQTGDMTPEIFEEPVNVPPSSEVEEGITISFHEKNITDGGEFLDDTIRMKEQWQ